MTEKKAILDELMVVEASRLNAEKAEAKGRVEGEAKGKLLWPKMPSGQYLEMRFGAESQAPQDTICTITVWMCSAGL
ncbi:MAG: hypothetical protein P4L49_07665 [Desulfosporosinus sp.]|nr:hypothetical protein [Desulfosporosinus sp.]